MNYAIQVANLSKDFRRGFFFGKGKITHALKGVNLDITRGESFGLLGINGAGKTTLIKILCGLILPTRGMAKISGLNILDNRTKKITGLASGEERSFYWRLTARQNLDFFSCLYGLSAASAKKRIDYLFDLLEIERPDRRFQEYSVGMKQRLLIARALLHDPQVLFMDEPTKSLDYFSANRLRKFIKEELLARQNKTVFFTTHNLEEIEQLSDRIAIIHKGQIKATGTMQQLRQKAGRQDATLGDVFGEFIKQNNL